MDDTRLLNIEKQMTEQGQLLQRVANALLGSFEQGSVGLIEEQRTLKRRIEELTKLTNEQAITIEAQASQLNDLVAFRKDIKKVVGIISITIPVIFTCVKWLVEALWTYAHTH